MATVSEEINALVERLPVDRQKWVLEYVQRLVQADQDSNRNRVALPKTPLPPGKPSSALLNFRSTLPLEDVEAMERALEDCERIEPDEQ